MQYFKNTELAQLYNVSEKSVRNWVRAASEGKMDFQLHTENGKQYMANTAHNTALVEELIEKGKKYKNSRAFKSIRPRPVFYTAFSREQILDIISNLDIHREIPHEYGYFGQGAEHWDQYTTSELDSTSPTLLTTCIELLGLTVPYLDELLASYSRINVVDLGGGNGLPVRQLLAHLLERGKLGRYIDIDTSPTMMEIDRRNIEQWFGGQVAFEGYVRDIAYDRFNDLLVADSFGEGDCATANLVLLLGDTLSNYRQPEYALQTISNCMGKRDFFIINHKLDSPASRRYFDFNRPQAGSSFNLWSKDVLNALGIDSEFYEVEQLFVEERMAREIRIKLKLALEITFELDGKQRVVALDKGESILLLRIKHQDTNEFIELVGSSNFELVQAMRSKDQGYILLTAKIKESRR